MHALGGAASKMPSTDFTQGPEASWIWEMETVVDFGKDQALQEDFGPLRLAFEAAIKGPVIPPSPDGRVSGLPGLHHNMVDVGPHHPLLKTRPTRGEPPIPGLIPITMGDAPTSDPSSEATRRQRETASRDLSQNICSE